MVTAFFVGWLVGVGVWFAFFSVVVFDDVSVTRCYLLFDVEVVKANLCARPCDMLLPAVLATLPPANRDLTGRCR